MVNRSSSGLEWFACFAAILFVLEMAGPGKAQQPPANVVSEPASSAPAEEFIYTGRVVDEQGNGVAGVSVVATRGPMSAESDSDGRFRLKAPPDFSKMLPALRVVPWQILAKYADGRQGIAAWNAKPMQIVLKPPRELKVEVKGAAGEPLAGTSIYVVIGRSLMGEIPWHVLEKGESDAQGRWKCYVPIDAQIEQVAAVKSGQGFDHFSTLKTHAGVEHRPLPEPVVLKLDGARTIRFHVTDRKGQPLAGIMIHPLRIRTHEDTDPCSVGWQESQGLTDATGTATFDWLPKTTAGAIQFRCASDRYHTDQNLLTIAPSGDQDINVKMVKNARILGRVAFADGAPAAGLQIRAAGYGRSGARGAQATTAADGSYEIVADPERSNIVWLDDKRWAATSHVGVMVKEDEDTANVDFTAVEGTILRGSLTVGAKKDSLPDGSMYVSRFYGPNPFARPFPGEVIPNMSEIRPAATDREGKFQFCLPPGKYELNGNLQTLKPIVLEIAEPREIVHDVNVPRAAGGTARDRAPGKVVDAQGKAMGGAVVSGTPRSPVLKYAGFTMTRPTDGYFEFIVACIPLVLHAKTRDGLLAGIARIENDDQDRTVRIDKTAAATGRIVARDADVAPRLRYGIPVYEDELAKAPTSQIAFGDLIQLSPDGKFELKTLIPGEEYVIEYEAAPDSDRWTRITTCKAASAEPFDLGDLRLPAGAK